MAGKLSHLAKSPAEPPCDQQIVADFVAVIQLGPVQKPTNDLALRLGVVERSL